MEKLIFGTYLKILKDAYAKRISNEDLINELYDSVTEGTGVVNKENYVPTVAKTTASYISNMTANVLGLVVECGSRPDAKQRCMSFFKKKIIPRLECVSKSINPRKKRRKMHIVKKTKRKTGSRCRI